MGSFRGNEGNGWKVILAKHPSSLERNLEILNKKYDFLDCQFSVDGGVFYALVLLGKEK